MRKPLYLPYGSIRAIITLIICATTSYLLFINAPVPLSLCLALFIILGYYFGHRSNISAQPEQAPEEHGPLGLPRGTIRWLIVLNFCAVTLFLYLDDRLWNNQHALTVLGLSFGLFAGAGFKWIQHYFVHPKNKEISAFISHLKAVLAIIVVLVFATIVVLDRTADISHNWQLSFIAFLAFYFGTR